MAAARRDIAPFLQRVRNFLLGRPHTLAVRFEDGLANRTQPLPNLPEGPSNGLSANYYYGRDARRLVTPPIDLTKQTLLESTAGTAKLPTPGKVYRWD